MRLLPGFVLAGAICQLAGVSAAQVVGTIVAQSDRDFSRPHDVVLSPDGAFLYVADVGSDSTKVPDPATLVTLGAHRRRRLSYWRWRRFRCCCPCTHSVLTGSCRKARPISWTGKGNDMDVFIGLDVSLASTAICVLGEKGKIVTEAQVASAPESLVAFNPVR